MDAEAERTEAEERVRGKDTLIWKKGMDTTIYRGKDRHKQGQAI